MSSAPSPGTAAFWRDRPVLVTGGTGLVGSSLVAELLALGCDLVCLVRDWIPGSELVRSGDIERVRVVRGSVVDLHTLERVLGDYEIDTVFHLAAQTIVSVANRNPVETFESNVAGSWSILEAARRSPTVKQIVTASSDKAYGAKDELPYDETMSLTGQHPYDVSKSCADLIAQSYAHTYQLPVAVTRCGNFYGGGDLNWNRIVPGTIRSILRGKQPIIRSDGLFVRDYIYVRDAVGAYICLAEALAADPKLRGEPFNFSTEEPISVRELVDQITRLMDSELEPVVLNEATNEIRKQYLCAAKARRVLGWMPRYALEDGLRETIAWYRAFFEPGS